jgi:hypothetical protein
VAEGGVLYPPSGTVDHPRPDGHDVERVRDLGGMRELGVERRPERLVQVTDRHSNPGPPWGDLPDALGVGDQRRAVEDDTVHHGVPRHAQFGGDLGHRPGQLPDLGRRPQTSPPRESAARSGDPVVALGPGATARRA